MVLLHFDLAGQDAAVLLKDTLTLYLLTDFQVIKRNGLVIVILDLGVLVRDHGEGVRSHLHRQGDAGLGLDGATETNSIVVITVVLPHADLAGEDAVTVLKDAFHFDPLTDGQISDGAFLMRRSNADARVSVDVNGPLTLVVFSIHSNGACDRITPRGDGDACNGAFEPHLLWIVGLFDLKAILFGDDLAARGGRHIPLTQGRVSADSDVHRQRSGVVNRRAIDGDAVWGTEADRCARCDVGGGEGHGGDIGWLFTGSTGVKVSVLPCDRHIQRLARLPFIRLNVLDLRLVGSSGDSHLG